jgi:hypothetical protein
VTAANGCTDTEVISVTQDDNVPTAAITNNTATTVLTCNVTSIGVTATGGVSYSWSDGTAVVGTSGALSITAPGTYTVTVTAANGCTDTESITIIEDKNLTSSIDITVCDQLVINDVTYTQSGTYTQALKNAAGCDSTLTIVATVLKSNSETIEVSGCDVVTLNGVDYTVSGTYTQNLQNIAGCDSTLTIVATVTPCIIEPDMKLEDDNATTLMNTPVTVSVQSNDKEIPQGSTMTTPATTTTGGAIKINDDGSVTYTPPTDFVGEDKFEYKITTPDGRKDSAMVIITVNAPEDLKITAVDDEFEIYNDEIAGGSITINDINPIGKIVINTTPVVAPNNGTVIINPDGTIFYTPNVDFSGTDSFSYQICNSIVPTLCDIAEVKIIVMDTDTVIENPITAEEIFIPNGFSPNDDGINEYFTITLYGEDSNGVYKEQAFESKFPNAKVEIFNRWGNLVFVKENFGNINHWGDPSLAWWDGRSNKGLTVGSDKLPAATYFYILYFNEGTREPKAGSIFLNR